jgi:hypothetical protein
LSLVCQSPSLKLPPVTADRVVMRYALLVLLLTPTLVLASNWDQVPALEAQKFARKEKELLSRATPEERTEYLKIKLEYLQRGQVVKELRGIKEAVKRSPSNNTTVIQQNYYP